VLPIETCEIRSRLLDAYHAASSELSLHVPALQGLKRGRYTMLH